MLFRLTQVLNEIKGFPVFHGLDGNALNKNGQGDFGMGCPDLFGQIETTDIRQVDIDKNQLGSKCIQLAEPLLSGTGFPEIGGSKPIVKAVDKGFSERRIWINYQDVKHAENLPEPPFDQSKNIPGITGFVQDCGHWQKIKTQIHLEFTKKQHHVK